MKTFSTLTLQTSEKNGKIYSIAELQNFPPFPIRRFYFIQGDQQPTGQHCHKVEEEFFVMIKGACTAIIDRGNGKEEIPLHAPSGAIYVPNYVWHGFTNFAEGSILLALSSTNYVPDRSDYIENYEEYLMVRDANLKK